MLRVIPDRADLGRITDAVARALSHSVAIESVDVEVVWWCIKQDQVRSVF
jgi:hypothetical protein